MAGEDIRLDLMVMPVLWMSETVPTVPATGQAGIYFNETGQLVAWARPASVFEMTIIEPKVGDELVLNWSSVAGKFYAIQYGSNLLSGLNSDGVSNIIATPPMNSYTVTVGETAPTLFYRVVVEE